GTKGHRRSVLEADDLVAKRLEDMLGNPIEGRAPGVDAKTRYQIVGRVYRLDFERVVVNLLVALEIDGGAGDVGQLLAIFAGGIEREDDVVGGKFYAVAPGDAWTDLDAELGVLFIALFGHAIGHFGIGYACCGGHFPEIAPG